MDKNSKRVDLDDLADDTLDELNEDEVRRVTGGSRVAGDGFAIGTPKPSRVEVRGWNPMEKKAFIGKADE